MFTIMYWNQVYIACGIELIIPKVEFLFKGLTGQPIHPKPISYHVQLVQRIPAYTKDSVLILFQNQKKMVFHQQASD